MKRLAFLGCVLACITMPALAVSFLNVPNGVYSTGFDNNAMLLGSGAVDPHYVLIYLPSGCSGVSCQENSTPGNLFGPNSYVVMGPNGTYPLNGVWLANDSTSQWIGPRADQTNPVEGGTTFPDTAIFTSDTDFYVYRMVFNLTLLGLSPSGAFINLAWLSDNNAGSAGNNAHIRLCSITSATDTNPCPSSAIIPGSGNAGQGSATLTAVNIQDGVNATFSSGFMALDFIVYNQVGQTGWLNPSGLRVQILAADAQIPEPATLALTGLGLLGLAFANRRRRAS